MKFYIDTADINEIKDGVSLGLVDGVTTNPTLVAKTGRDFKDVLKDICKEVNGPISAEVVSLEADKIVAEGRELAKLHDNIVVKIPMCAEGVKAVKRFAADRIKTNVTLIFSPLQALLCAKAGANFVSPFVGDDLTTWVQLEWILFDRSEQSLIIMNTQPRSWLPVFVTPSMS